MPKMRSNVKGWKTPIRTKLVEMSPAVIQTIAAAKFIWSQNVKQKGVFQLKQENVR